MQGPLGPCRSAAGTQGPPGPRRSAAGTQGPWGLHRSAAGTQGPLDPCRSAAGTQGPRGPRRSAVLPTHSLTLAVTLTADFWPLNCKRINTPPEAPVCQNPSWWRQGVHTPSVDLARHLQKLDTPRRHPDPDPLPLPGPLPRHTPGVGEHELELQQMCLPFWRRQGGDGCVLMGSGGSNKKPQSGQPRQRTLASRSPGG